MLLNAPLLPTLVAGLATGEDISSAALALTGDLSHVPYAASASVLLSRKTCQAAPGGQPRAAVPTWALRGSGPSLLKTAGFFPASTASLVM